MDELQALHVEAVRPPEGTSAAPEGPDKVISEVAETLLEECATWTPEGPLQQAPYNTPQDVASIPRSLADVA